MSGIRVLLLQQSGGGGFWTVLMSVYPKMCDLDPLSPLSSLPLVLVISRSCVSCLVLCSCSGSCSCWEWRFCFCFFLSACRQRWDYFSVFGFFLCFPDSIFFFFFFSWGDFGFVVFVFPSCGCFCCPCCSIIEREVRMCGRGKRTGHMNAGKTE